MVPGKLSPAEAPKLGISIEVSAVMNAPAKSIYKPSASSTSKSISRPFVSASPPLAEKLHPHAGAIPI